MAQRLVLTSKDGLIPVYQMRAFVREAEKFGQEMKRATYSVYQGELRIILVLPKNVRVINGRRVRIKPKTKKARQVEEQIKTHKEKKQTGEQEGYVPPHGRKTAPKPKKIKCPVCDVRKQVVTVAKVKTIKPHVSKGETCPGSGMQVVTKGRTLVVVEPKKGKK